MLSAAEWAIIGLSLKISLVAILLTLPVAFALAWVLARGRFPGRMLLDALVHLPLVLPPVVSVSAGASGAAVSFVTTMPTNLSEAVQV